MANPFRPQEVEIPPAPEGCLPPLLRRFIIIAVLGLLISVAALGYIPFIGTANIGGQQTIETVGQSPQPTGRFLQLVVCYAIMAGIGGFFLLIVAAFIGIRRKKRYIVSFWIILAIVFIVKGDWIVVFLINIGGYQDNTLVYTNAAPWFQFAAFALIMATIFALATWLVGSFFIGGLEANREANEKLKEKERPMFGPWNE